MINQVLLDKSLDFVIKRCYGNSAVNRQNVLNFLEKSDRSFDGPVQVQVAFASFREMTSILEEIEKIEPNRTMRFHYSRLARAIIDEDYLKAEEIKNKINRADEARCLTDSAML